METTKICAKCNIEKPTTKFYTKDNKTRFSYRCKSCDNEARKESYNKKMLTMSKEEKDCINSKKKR